jgi:IS30 family transposase
MSFAPLSPEQQDNLKSLYYDDKLFVGRQKLWHAYMDHFPNEKPPSQRSVQDWLSHQQVHQQFVRPMKKSIVRPNRVIQKGYISLDCVLLPNFNGYSVVYNCVDSYSKRYYALPFQAQTAENTIKFFETLMSRFPEFKVSTIQCDNGSEFQEPFRSWAERKGIKVLYSKPHVPQSNIVERYGGSMKRMLFQALTASNSSDWVNLLPTIVQNMNSMYSFIIIN